MNDLVSWIPRGDLLFGLILASILGGAIGLERELSGKPAGFRTNLLICVGAALLTDLSILIAVSYDGDPGRITAQIVSGIGFLGAGAVLAGVLEPPSALPVVIEDEVLVGANAVVLEGCRVGKGSVVAAGAVVTSDVPAGVVAAGQPARVIKQIDQKTKDKTGLLKELRRLNED